MSEVKRFPAKKFHPDSEVILALHYDDAQSELAALREELAKAKVLSVINIMMDVVPGYDGMGLEVYAKSVAEVELLISNLYLAAEERDERLAAAEQRNAELVDLLTDAYGAIDENDGWKQLCARILAVIQPTESASAVCTSCDGSGEYVDAIGDWRGYCSCHAGVALKNKPTESGASE